MRMYDFKNKLAEMINQSGLSIEEVYYIWKDLFDEITINYNSVIKQEQQQVQKEEENKEDDEEVHE